MANYSSIDDIQVLALKNAMDLRRKLQGLFKERSSDVLSNTYYGQHAQREFLDSFVAKLSQKDTFFITMFLDYFQQESSLTVSAKQEALYQVQQDHPHILSSLLRLSEVYPKSRHLGDRVEKITEQIREEIEEMRIQRAKSDTETTNEEWEQLQLNNPTLVKLREELNTLKKPSEQDIHDFVEHVRTTFIELANQTCQNLETALHQTHAMISPSSISIKREARLETDERAKSNMSLQG